MTATLATSRAAPGSAHPAPLLITKLAPPRLRPTLVPRPRLTKQLDLGTCGALTLISAPAGFGKTSLLSAWIADYNEPNLNLQSTIYNLQSAIAEGSLGLAGRSG